jgi:hypothetical protein
VLVLEAVVALVAEAVAPADDRVEAADVGKGPQIAGFEVRLVVREVARVLDPATLGGIFALVFAGGARSRSGLRRKPGGAPEATAAART